MLKRSNTWFMASLTLAAACWGVATVISKGVLGEIPPLTLLVTQLFVSVAFLVVLLVLQRAPVKWGRDLLSVGWLGWLNPGISYTLSLLGLTLTTASMFTVLWSAEPILILGLAWHLLRERLTLRLIGLSALALVGVALAVGPGADLRTGNSLAGNGLILAGVVCCALYTVLTRRSSTKADPLVVVAVQQIFALVWALLIWPFELWSAGFADLMTIHPLTWFWAVVSGIVYYALAFWFFVAGLRRVPASLAGVFINLIPVFGLSTAYVALGERLLPVQWLGAGLILAAVFGILLEPKRATNSDCLPIVE